MQVPPEKKSSGTSGYILFFYYFLIFQIIFFIYRLAFYSIYSYRIRTGAYLEVANAFLAGLRFDLSVSAFALAPFFILSCILPLNRHKAYRFAWGYLPNIVILWAIAHLVADLIYFEHGNKHLGYEAFVVLGKDVLILIGSVWQQSPVLLLVILGSMLLYLFASYYLFAKNFVYGLPQNRARYFSTSFLILLVMVLLARGGWQKSFLRPSHAIVSKNVFMNQLGLNGIFTTFHDMSNRKIPDFHTMQLEQAREIVKEEIKYPGAEFISDTYPLLRKQKGNGSGQKPDIFLVIQESWTGKFVKHVGEGYVGGIEVTPFYNRLAEQGLLFTNFFATGGRTTNGLLAVLTGIPDRPGLSYLHSSVSAFPGLGSILQQAGYETVFVTGSDLEFENMRPHIAQWGFDTIINQDDFSRSGKYKKGIWGYHDADIFDLVNDLAVDKSKPLAVVVLTISTHHPYKVPHEKFAVFPQNIADADYLNAYRYSDWAISEFITKAKQSPKFNNSVFIFVADHSHHRYLNYFEDRKIPFLIYSPALVPPGIEKKTASQLDIVPTILGFIDYDFTFAAMGKDLRQPSRHPSAYFAYGNLFGWIDANDFSFVNLDAANENVNETPGITGTGNPYCILYRKNCEYNETKAKAFLNFADVLLRENRIFPVTVD